MSIKTYMAALALCLLFVPASSALASKSARIESAGPSGPRVVLRAAPGDVCAACVFVPVGTALEDESRNGITNLLNSVILNGGGVSPADSPKYAIEKLGGRVEAHTYSDYACFSLVAPADGFARALGILADAIGSPDINGYSIESEKRRITAESEMALDSAESDVYREFLAKTYEGTSYALAPEGRYDTLAGIGEGDMERWFTDHYSSSGMVVSVAAGSEAGEAAYLVEEAFGGYYLPDEDAYVLVGIRESIPVTETARYESPSSVGGSAAMLGYTAPPMNSPDYAAVKLAEAVVAEGMGSRLFRSFRGEDRLAYSFGSVMPETVGVSRLAFYVSAYDEKIDSAVDAVRGAVDALKDGGPTDEELDRARAAVIGNIRIACDDPAGVAWRTGLYEFMGLGSDYGDRLAEQVQDLDAADVREAAMRYLDKYTLVIIKPENRLR